METENKDETSILQRRESVVSDDGTEETTTTNDGKRLLSPLLPKEKLEYLTIYKSIVN
jgi:hypothetical protein